jgi:hypothetical protein
MLLRHYSMEEIQEWYDSISFKTRRSLPITETRECTHNISGYEVNPEDCSVWCFKCNPPREVSSPALEEK